jgi:hypothetical protein
VCRIASSEVSPLTMPGRDFRRLIDAARSEEINGDVLASKALHGKSKKAYTTADYASLLAKAKGKRTEGAKRAVKMKGLKVCLQCACMCACVNGECEWVG